MEEYQDIILQKQGNIAIMSLNREEVLNAVRARTWAELLDALNNVKCDSAIRCLILTGKGKAFSAGQDLSEMESVLGADVNYHEVRKGLLNTQKLTREMMNMPKSIIAAVNGYAVGGGAEIAIASDIRIASDKAKFEFAEVKVGLFATNGVTYFLPRLIGFGRAKELMLTGRRIDAQEAFQIGLVSKVVEDGMLMEEALKVAESIAETAPVSGALVKQCLNKSGEISLEDAMVYETEAIMSCVQTLDAREGAVAFLENRKPKFQGK
ncbi:MAG: enoyl-CoA hydratase/isomerase family protein [Dehalococcoidia bacterium]